MLIQPLSLDLVHGALECLNGTSAPGIDGVQVYIYKTFSDFFCPIMLDIHTGILSSKTLNDNWLLALLNPIPKGLRTASVHNLRPLALQNTSHKWVAAILALQLRDYIDTLTAIQQRGFIRGRSSFTNLWHTFGSWSSPGDALCCPIDFKKAFDSVSHEYTRTFLNLMQLPQSLISLCLQLFTAPICVLVRITFTLTTKSSLARVSDKDAPSLHLYLQCSFPPLSINLWICLFTCKFCFT